MNKSIIEFDEREHVI